MSIEADYIINDNKRTLFLKVIESFLPKTLQIGINFGFD